MQNKGFIVKFIFFCVFCTAKLHAQYYNFTKFGLKEGLPQSQVSVIYQAKNRTLWLGTFGGVSNYDGKTFTTYSKADGLISNSVRSIVEGNQGQIYIGTELGLNILFNNKISTRLPNHYIAQLKKDKNGIIWGLSDRKLFHINGGKIVYSSIKNSSITCLSTNHAGDLFAFVLGKGIFKLENGIWKLYQEFPNDIATSNVSKIIFDKNDPTKIFLLSNKLGVFSIINNQVKPVYIRQNIGNYHTIALDDKSNLWVGTDQGAFLLKKNKTTIYFNADNGLSDNPVFDVFKDEENNMWISCFSDGLFKYEGDAFIRYITFKGKSLSFPISGLAADKKNNLWIGSSNKGLLKYNGKELETINTPELKNRNILFVYSDKAKNIWVSAQDKGIWKYNGFKFSQVLKPEITDFTSIAEDMGGGYWLNRPKETLYYKDGKIKQIVNLRGYNSCIYPLSNDSVLIGTSAGIHLIKNKSIDSAFKIKELEGVYVLSMAKHRELILFATLGDGIVSWNQKTKAVRKYTVANGLNSNDVYSLNTDENGNLWIGTGRGINKLKLNLKLNKYEVLKNSTLIVECNQGAIVNYNNSMVIGTINGLIRCKTNTDVEFKPGPKIIIDFIKFFNVKNKSKDITIPGDKIGPSLKKLNPDQNHLLVSFRSVYLTNPNHVVFLHKLVGVDNDFSSPIGGTEVEYSSLNPGTYTFKVYAVADGKASNVEQFNFTIIAPFYDTIPFKITAVCCFILIVWLVFFLFYKNRELRAKQLETIKLEEQEKIRKQTAEDFHDDIGNKLTRINVLSEILDKQVKSEQVDQKELIRLIKENTNLIYRGTKDILWALDPTSDNLWAILTHVKNFGVDLFESTNISFNMQGLSLDYEKINLSMAYNRNLTLIFKESLNNILKHAKAKSVNIKVLKKNEEFFQILICDDGIGFDKQKINYGRGLKNIETRVKRINSLFNIESNHAKGTTIEIFLNINVTNYKN